MRRMLSTLLLVLVVGCAGQTAKFNSILDEHKAQINTKILSRIVTPPDLPGDPVAEFEVTLLPGGDILQVELRRSSGFAAFDSAALKAIYLSRPLPVPLDPLLFKYFRVLYLKVHYRNRISIGSEIVEVWGSDTKVRG